MALVASFETDVKTAVSNEEISVLGSIVPENNSTTLQVAVLVKRRSIFEVVSLTVGDQKIF